MTWPHSGWSSQLSSGVPELSVLTYDSFMAEGGLGRELVSRFEKYCNCKVHVQIAGDAAQLVSRLQLEHVRKKITSHVVVGIDDSLWPEVRSFALEWMPNRKFVHQVELGFVPFDFGVLALMWNPKWKGFSNKAPPLPPRYWRDLLSPQWKKRVLLQDPRTSTPGLGFLRGARAVFGENTSGFFRELRSQWLTLTPGWSGSYDLFLREEAPLVWSYTSSQAYHRMKESDSKFQAIVFEDGNPLQIEGAFIVASATSKSATRQLAQSFLSYLVSPEIQKLIPTRQWMFPAVQGVELPADFRELPKPLKALLPDRKVETKKLLSDWELSIR
ncbi:MAG: thiamine ABC transporter substrate-binding protein [Bdellovibrionales bacterium]|nr:thiamine ABC transporter substrate-binding protein [Bdellovibrionales bacterium]